MRLMKLYYQLKKYEMKVKDLTILVVVICMFLPITAYSQEFKWSEETANDWYKSQPWMAGCNYLPQYAINQIEMWQKETFNPESIEKELTLAENLGFKTLRVFLHDKVWEQDRSGFKGRIDQFLTICDKHHIRVLFVIFDSCWDPFPVAGKQKDPVPGVHNSGWVQSPGAELLTNENKYSFLEEYVKDIVGSFNADKRIIGWDVWNEPDNLNTSAYGKVEPLDKIEWVRKLLPLAFQWARSQKPQQPLTSGLWKGDWSSPDSLSPVQKIQIEYSDIISFHNYDGPNEFEKRVKYLQGYNRPIFCTEFMARGNNSFFKEILPICKHYKIAAYNWGFVSGKSNTIYPWDSWRKPYTVEPPVWFHDIYRSNGIPYLESEESFIRKITGVNSKVGTKE